MADWVSKNDDAVKSLPIYFGGLSLLAVLFNRTVSGIAPVADDSSSQSRTYLLTPGLAVTNILNGLVWLSIRPKSISVVDPEGVECQRIHPHLPDCIVSELLWSLVVIYDRRCVLQIGVAAASSSNAYDAIVVDVDKFIQGSLQVFVQDAFQKMQICALFAESYLANLSLYPAKSEVPFLPSNTRTVILQPLGDTGLAIIGGDTIRGFTTSDQAWITLVGEKLDVIAKTNNISLNA